MTVELPLVGAEGTFRLLPWTAGDRVRDGGRYLFRVDRSGRTVVSIEPRELFTAQPDDANAGDFRPRNCVGDVRVVLTFDDGVEASVLLDVAPTKLQAETEYRAMLEQIADHAAEAVLEGFAPASMSVHPDTSADAATAYRSLAFLSARLRDEAFLAAIDRLRSDPHRDWVSESVRRPVGSGLPADPRLGDRLRSAGGASHPVPPHLRHLPVDRLPASVEVRRTDVIYDTPPNRFVRHVFSRWQGLALDVLATLDVRGAGVGPGPLGRGRREAQWVVDRCEELLGLPALREAGRMTAMPAGNPVLLRRAGYRDVLRAFALAEGSMALEAVLPDDPFSATQRNVAALYEYWCFVALVECVSAVAGTPPRELLFEPSATGLSLKLKQGEASRLTWDVDVDGRALRFDLWFNRSFRLTDDVRDEMGSWARLMRPDASLRIQPRSGRPGDAADPELDVWLHFDAKYRIDRLRLEEPVVGDREGSATEAEVVVGATREDLLKMHAYRDTIRRSAGAYVLYPGSGPPALSREFHEVLPGIGAFPLRPVVGEGAGAAGAPALAAFLQEVARQVGNQASAMERTQYWSGRHAPRRGPRVRPVGFLPRPPADTLVLVGHVRDEQVPWVARNKRYNVRVGDRPGAVDVTDEMLTADLVVLWRWPGSDRPGRGSVPVVLGVFERTGPWQFMVADELAVTGYPLSEHADRYLVTAIEPLEATVEDLVRPATIEAGPDGWQKGGPWSTTWADLLSAG